jgi:hypothetical protein
MPTLYPWFQFLDNYNHRAAATHPIHDAQSFITIGNTISVPIDINWSCRATREALDGCRVRLLLVVLSGR